MKNKIQRITTNLGFSTEAKCKRLKNKVKSQEHTVLLALLLGDNFTYEMQLNSMDHVDVGLIARHPQVNYRQRVRMLH